MRRILVIAILALTGCQTPSADTQGTGTASTDPADMSKIGSQIDKSDQRVAASIAVAAENSDKPGVVKAELGVAASYLPRPDAQAVDYVRNRVARANPEEYRRAEEAGRKLMAVIETNWAKAEQDAAKNKAALDNANKQIAALKVEIEQVRTEGVRNAFAVAAGICFLASLAMALLGQYMRSVAALVIGGAIGGLPFVFNSLYFVPAVGFLAVVGLSLVWLHFRKPATCPQPIDGPKENSPNP
jgi:hypothetical protein